MILGADHITKTYSVNGRAVHALNDVTFHIPKGEFVTITGASGAGKTTLLLVLGGLIHPTSGSLTFDNKPVNLNSDRELTAYRRQHIGYVMQHFALVPYLTAEENVLLALNNGSLGQKDQMKKAKNLLKLVSLEHRLNHYPRQLSAGQQQRVAIARALANNPSIILADEPTGNLDPALAKEILVTLRDINQRKGTTIIMVTHNAEAAAFGTTRLNVDQGRVIN